MQTQAINKTAARQAGSKHLVRNDVGTNNMTTPYTAISRAMRISAIPICRISMVWQDPSAPHDRRPGPADEALNEHERHAEAAMIMAKVSRLPFTRRVLILGYFDRLHRVTAIVALADRCQVAGVSLQEAREYCAKWLGERQFVWPPQNENSFLEFAKRWPEKSKATHWRRYMQVADWLQTEMQAGLEEVGKLMGR